MLHKFKLLRLRWLQALKSNSLALAFHRWIVWTQFELLILFYSPAATFRQSAASKHHPEPPIEKQNDSNNWTTTSTKSIQILPKSISTEKWRVQIEALRSAKNKSIGNTDPNCVWCCPSSHRGITGCVDKPKSGAPMLMLWFSCM